MDHRFDVHSVYARTALRVRRFALGIGLIAVAVAGLAGLYAYFFDATAAGGATAWQLARAGLGATVAVLVIEVVLHRIPPPNTRSAGEWINLITGIVIGICGLGLVHYVYEAKIAMVEPPPLAEIAFGGMLASGIVGIFAAFAQVRAR